MIKKQTNKCYSLNGNIKIGKRTCNILSNINIKKNINNVKKYNFKSIGDDKDIKSIIISNQ